MVGVTVHDETQWSNIVLSFIQRVVSKHYHLLPINSYHAFEDWVYLAFRDTWKVYKMKNKLTFPYTFTHDDCKLIKAVTRQAILNEVQTLTTKQRDINATYRFSELESPDDERSFDELVSSRTPTPEQVFIFLEKVKMLLDHLRSYPQLYELLMGLYEGLSTVELSRKLHVDYKRLSEMKAQLKEICVSILLRC